MKKYLFIILTVVFMLSGIAEARCNQANCGMLFYDLGTSSGGISKHPGTLLVDKDLGIVITPTDFYAYSLDADGAESEASPYWEVPGATAGDKNWKLVNGNFGGLIEVWDTSANNDIRLNTAGDSWLNGGDVGIGITSPEGTLHIRTSDSGGTANALADDLIVDVSGNGGISILSTGDGHIFFGDAGSATQGRISYAHGTDSITIYTNVLPQMTILSDGKVGIGTVSPESALHVVGSILFEPTTVSAITSCGAGNAGETAYITFETSLCFCNGTNYIRTDDGTTCTDS